MNSGRTEREANVRVGATPGKYKGRSSERPSGYKCCEYYAVSRQYQDILNTFSKPKIYVYTSKAFWCTPEGSDGFKHCANRFATVVLCGTTGKSGGCD